MLEYTTYTLAISGRTKVFLTDIWFFRYSSFLSHCSASLLTLTEEISITGQW